MNEWKSNGEGFKGMAEQGGRSADGAGGVDEGEPTGVIGPKTKDHHTAHHHGTPRHTTALPCVRTGGKDEKEKNL